MSIYLRRNRPVTRYPSLPRFAEGRDFRSLIKAGHSIETARLYLDRVGFKQDRRVSAEENLCSYIFNRTGTIIYDEMFQLGLLEALEKAVETEFMQRGGSEAFCFLLNQW